jgi:hypothetical protein
VERPNMFLIVLCVALAAFIVGRWARPGASVKADSGNSPQIEIRPVSGDSSLIVYYPTENKFFVYQNPFVGLPTWGCAYSIQLSTPGGRINRQPCSKTSQDF